MKYDYTILFKRPNANRISGIYAQLHFNRTVFKYYLLESVHPEDWNFKTKERGLVVIVRKIWNLING